MNNKSKNNFPNEKTIKKYEKEIMSIYLNHKKSHEKNHREDIRENHRKNIRENHRENHKENRKENYKKINNNKKK